MFKAEVIDGRTEVTIREPKNCDIGTRFELLGIAVKEAQDDLGVVLRSIDYDGEYVYFEAIEKVHE